MMVASNIKKLSSELLYTYSKCRKSLTKAGCYTSWAEYCEADAAIKLSTTHVAWISVKNEKILYDAALLIRICR